MIGLEKQSDGTWAIVHLPTGMMIAGFATYEDARDAKQGLDESDCHPRYYAWDRVDELHD